MIFYKETTMPVDSSNLLKVIDHNRSRKAEAQTIIQKNPVMLPVIPKLTADNRTDPTRDTANRLNMNRDILQQMHEKMLTNRKNNENIVKLFPDIELAIQIIVSSILSPKKLTDTTLTYKLQKKFQLNPTITGLLLEETKNYIEENYELEDKQAEIIRDALFTSGAYVEAVIPESSIDEIINNDILPSYSAENFKTTMENVVDTLRGSTLGFLGNTTPVQYDKNKIDSNPEEFIKSLVASENLNVTDNYGILKFPDIQSNLRSQVIKKSVRGGVAVAQESMAKLQYVDIFRQRASTIGKVTSTVFVNTKNNTKRKSIGKPMVVRIPTESIIPVFIPGNQSEHVGYFVLLDETGKPLNDGGFDETVTSTSRFNNSTTPGQVSLTQKAYNNLVKDSDNDINTNQLFEMYKGVLEKQLYESIRSSLLGKAVDIGDKSDIYFMMFTRALAGQKTNLLYLPKELVVYYAFYYNKLGVGKSLLDNMNIITSMRAIMLFSKVMSYAKQSIDVTRVDITLDPNDTDPDKTIEQIKDGVYRLRQGFFPLGLNNPTDITMWLQRAGLQFAYSNNPLIPDTKIEFQNSNIQHTVPNTDLDEDLRKQSIMTLGLSPETVDNANGPEFATTVVNNSVLMTKRVMVYQKKHTKNLSKFVSLLVTNDEDLRSRLKEILIKQDSDLEKTLNEDQKTLKTTNKDDFLEKLLDDIAENISVELPKPDNSNIMALSGEFDIYKENLGKVLDSVISSETLSEDISGEMANHVDTVKNVFKHHLLRKWMAENNYYPEVLEISGTNSDEVDGMLSLITEHLSYSTRNGAKLLKMMQEFKKAVDSDLSGITGTSGTDSGTSSSSDTTDENNEENNEDEMSLDMFNE